MKNKPKWIKTLDQLPNGFNSGKIIFIAHLKKGKIVEIDAAYDDFFNHSNNFTDLANYYSHWMPMNEGIKLFPKIK